MADEMIDMGAPEDVLPTLPQYNLEFYTNLVPFLEEDDLNNIGAELLQEVEEDEASRREYIETVEDAMRSFGRDGGVPADDSDSDLDMVRHILLEEACVHAQGKAMQEFNPGKGPVKFEIKGEVTDALKDRQERATEYINYQLKHVVND